MHGKKVLTKFQCAMHVVSATLSSALFNNGFKYRGLSEAGCVPNLPVSYSNEVAVLMLGWDVTDVTACACE